MASELTSAATQLLASVPDEWGKARLDEVCAVIDCPHTTPALTDEGPYVVRSQDMRTGFVRLETTGHVSEETYLERTRRSVPEYGDILYSREGTYFGIAAEVPRGERICLGQRMVQLRPNKTQLLPRFLRYWLNSPLMGGFIAGLRDGSVAERLNMSTIRALPVPLPRLSVQVQISEVLGTLDDRIELLRQTNATLESIAQALFKSWFIDFDPVRAKAKGREPEGMDAATAALFPSEFEESTLGLIPKGWRISNLAELAELNARSWSARRAPVEIAYIDLAGVKANVFDAAQRFAFSDAPSRARRELRTGDALVGTVRPGNRSFGFIAESEAGLTGSTGFAVLSPKQPEVAAFTYLCATRDENIERLAALADGGAYPAVRPDLVANTPCTLPPDSVMSAFASVAQPLLNAIATNAKRGSTLASLRDTLLPPLISGKLRLPEAQEELEGALA